MSVLRWINGNMIWKLAEMAVRDALEILPGGARLCEGAMRASGAGFLRCDCAF